MTDPTTIIEQARRRLKTFPSHPADAAALDLAKAVHWSTVTAPQAYHDRPEVCAQEIQRTLSTALTAYLNALDGGER